MIDSIISAEIPDKDADPLLYAVVTRKMMHGPCGDLNPGCVCMKNGRCEKRFPKNFCSETREKDDGYPDYRRRSPEEGGNSYTIKRGDREILMTNAWVVPYSPFLCRVFECHINLEMCHSIDAIKYVCKVTAIYF